MKENHFNKSYVDSLEVLL